MEGDKEAKGEVVMPPLLEIPSPTNDIPKWVDKIPDNLKLPPGIQVTFVRFKSAWTMVPSKGDRWCIVWPLTDGDEKAAFKRSMSDSNRVLRELTKQMIRAVDGVPVGAVGSVGDVDRWLDEVGPKCRSQLMRIYTKLNSMTFEEQVDFFESCVAVRSSV